MADADKAEKGTDPEQRQPGLAQAPASPTAGPSPQQPGDIQTYIGARLRQAFDDVAKQPVPDRFLQLMAELDRS